MASEQLLEADALLVSAFEALNRAVDCPVSQVTRAVWQETVNAREAIAKARRILLGLAADGREQEKQGSNSVTVTLPKPMSVQRVVVYGAEFGLVTRCIACARDAEHVQLLPSDEPWNWQCRYCGTKKASL